ncbi:NSS family neurotransmitter:Na+ symporter [Sinobacterium caligoides]|uniref:Transporter n=1 Tax=Sinobacterium caligoides TaxID=933926 RepID=A0A3N2DK75_9GAMM|nr:sodium-dependent transporter [Sinobacterium caligoides]ROS00072.1 NSS family neurotransmitter:Na+ symporter [Sinobacterium caligoides]
MGSASTNSSAVTTHWGSRLTFILAATGSAVGLGNIWKFPYMAGANGGGAFVMMYLAFIAIIGAPMLMNEVMVGRAMRRSPIGSMLKMTEQYDIAKFWRAIAWMGTIAALVIMSFYSVVAGWALDYIFKTGSGLFSGRDAEFVGSVFSQELAAPVNMMFWHFIFTALTVGIVAAGVIDGLEKALRFLMPLLFLLLLLMVGYSLATGDVAAGLGFLFTFKPEDLSWGAVLSALGQAVFTLSVGCVSMMVYGSYMAPGQKLGSTAVSVALLDTSVALLAGIAIFPIVFAHGIEPGAGPGLVFVSLPIAFADMPGGQFVGALFFILIAVAAVSSSISLLEPAVARMTEVLNMSRAKATLIVGSCTWLLGVGCVLSFNAWSDYTIAGKGLFDLLDYITANVLMPLGCMLIALLVGWALPRSFARGQLSELSQRHFALWYFITRYLVPFGVGVIFLFNLV